MKVKLWYSRKQHDVCLEHDFNFRCNLVLVDGKWLEYSELKGERDFQLSPLDMQIKLDHDNTQSCWSDAEMVLEYNERDSEQPKFQYR